MKRGQESWNDLRLVHGIVSVGMIALCTSVGLLGQYRVVAMISNLAITQYLFFFNGWFRNQIMGYVMRSREKIENLV